MNFHLYQNLYQEMIFTINRRHMKKVILILVLQISLINYSQEKTNEVINVSLVELICNSKTYNDNFVSVKGYFVDYGRYGRLFFNINDSDYSIYLNSIMIKYDNFDNCSQQPEELLKLNGKFISIDGYYYSRKTYLSNGVLTDLISFSEIKKSE